MTIRAALLLMLVPAACRDDSQSALDAAVPPAVAIGSCDAAGPPVSFSERDDALNWKQLDEDMEAFRPMRGPPPAPRTHEGSGAPPLGAAAGVCSCAPNDPLCVCGPAPVVTDAAVVSYPGAPTPVACKQAAAESKRPAATQLDANRQTGARDVLVRCDLAEAWRNLALSLSSNAVAIAKLQKTQERWAAYNTAHTGEVYPHRDEQGFYGSVLPMCELREDTVFAMDRVRELRTEGKCCDAAGADELATVAARAAGAVLNQTYSNVRAKHSDDPKFLSAVQHAQTVWGTFRDAQVEFARSASGATDSTCAQRELERVTKARMEVLRAWLRDYVEGDSCLGSRESSSIR